MITPESATIEVIDNEVALRQVCNRWDALSRAASPMQSPLWLLAWWKAHRNVHQRLCVLAVHNPAGELIGLVPWYRQSSIASGTTLRFLGSGRACSDYQTLLCEAESRDTVVQSVIQWLTEANTRTSTTAEGKPASWDLLDLEGVSSADVTMQEFIEGLAARGHITHRRPTEHTWRLDLTDGWQGFLGRQSKTQRNQARNFVNRFEKNAELSMRFASQERVHAEPMITALIELHQRRWQAAGQEGCFANPRMRSFFENAMRRMLAEGRADITLLERNHQPIAGHAWLLQNNTLYLYQSGREPKEEANRVGSIANAVVIRWACEQGLQTIDFLRGDESYKVKLRAEPTLSHRVRVVARANFPELRHKVWLACRSAKSRWQDLRKTKPTQTAPAETAEVAQEVAN